MLKLKRIEFHSHPVLGNIVLDFCNQSGQAVDTVIIAGENGVGKSVLLQELFAFTSHMANSEASLLFENDTDDSLLLEYYKRGNYLYVKDSKGLDIYSQNSVFAEKYPLSSVFSDVDISFKSQTVSSVTSLEMDQDKSSRKSNQNLPLLINQLIVDIQNLDDSELSKEYRDAKTNGTDTNTIKPKQRMPRFTKAFDLMFDDLKYSHVDNYEGHKRIIFEKNGTQIPIESLSSGEKQIVYRGCFLLKDKEALNGAFVFIDEPEISMHPNWQKKILNYYKSLFSNEEGEQTSQIFVATHSPFIVHNDSGNDKVIVLSRNVQGKIVVLDKPEYYYCNNTKIIEDAFSINDFNKSRPTVFLEGRTDEKYLKKASEVFNLRLPFDLQWIGHMGENGQEENTGSGALDRAKQFLLGKKLPQKIVLLYDCDTKKTKFNSNGLFVRIIPYHENKNEIKKGIENALDFGPVEIASFYSYDKKKTDYGGESTICELRKMELCNYICSLSNDKLKIIMASLKDVLSNLSELVTNC